MRAGIPTQLKVFDCEPAAKRREQLSLVCALDSGHNQVRFGKISPGRLQMPAVKCTNLRDRFSLRDRKSVVSGKSVSVRVDLGGRRIIKKKKQERENQHIDRHIKKQSRRN